jgi:EAL domain-containing protein (putative c-di-GMP-specific phosphodiesterase class I)
VEQTPMIHPLTLLVLEQSIAQCSQWRAQGLDLSVAVNLSVRNLHNPALPEEISALLSRYGVAPSALKLEITESMIMADPELITTTIRKLNGLGVRLSIDDFGTGFSSLAYLRNLPIDELKIDRSFVSPMLGSESDQIIVRSTINLGHDLGLSVVAEGVEDAPTLMQLSNLGCDLVQGYHVSRPMPAGAFVDWIAGARVPLLERRALPAPADPQPSYASPGAAGRVPARSGAASLPADGRSTTGATTPTTRAPAAPTAKAARGPAVAATTPPRTNPIPGNA